MNRDELKTDLGRYVYDYSEIPKSVCTDEVRIDIAEAYCVRYEINKSFWVKLDSDLKMFICVVDFVPTMQHYLEWRRAYENHGYSAPLLDLQTEWK